MKRFAILSTLFLLLAGVLAAQVNHSNTITMTCVNSCAGTGDPATGFYVWRQAATCTGMPVCSGTTCTLTPYATISSLTAPITFKDTAVVAGNQFCYAVTPFNTGGVGPAGYTSVLVTPFSLPTVPPTVSGVSQ
jgi:hypothetical protein